MAAYDYRHKSKSPHAPDAQLTAATFFTTRLILFWEKCAPALLKSAGVVALYCIATLFDLWRYMPWPLHYAVLLCFCASLWITLIPHLPSLTWPTHQHALRRLEQDATLSHHPLQTLEDTCFRGDKTLWAAHQKRMAQAAMTAKVSKPHACMNSVDPYFIRYVFIFALLLGGVVGWSDATPRFWRSIAPGLANLPPLRADVWIDPPGYTGASPILLAQNAELSNISHDTITVPQNAVMTIRLHDAKRTGFRKTAVKRFLPKHTRRDTLLLTTISNMNTQGLSIEIDADQTISLHHGGRRVSWSLKTIPDIPPSVYWHTKPTIVDGQYLALAGHIDDDYAITKAFIRFTLTPEQPRALDTPPLDQQITQTVHDIPLTGFTGQRSLRQTELDIAAHPWAGLHVRIALIVEDSAGQIARTQAIPITLPASPFYNPLAKAILYERQSLAIAPSQWPVTQRSLAALTVSPERYFNRPQDYLLLRAAYWDMTLGQGRNITHLVENFWHLALQLEDQDLALARRMLKSAQEALHQALATNAPQEIIDGLIADLKRAIQNYLQALALSDQGPSDIKAPSQELDAQALNKMMDKIADFAATGASASARQMLTDLKNLLDNLRISPPDGRSRDPQQGGLEQSGRTTTQANAQTLGSAGDLIDQQRRLTDRTFTAIRQAHGLPIADNTTQTSHLIDTQRHLARQLSHILQSLDQSDKQADIDASPLLRTAITAYTKAARTMQTAEQHLMAGRLGDATLSQSEALEALRDGAKSLVKALDQKQQVLRPDNDDRHMQDDGSDTNMTDPLGRAYSAGIGLDVFDLENSQTAYELLLELRQRLAEPERSQSEVDYLERLLNLRFETQKSSQ